MILTAHQPAYLPYLGYFEKILKSDIFIYLDNVQFEKNSFINRNKIKSPQGEMWLTVPVLSKGHISFTIKDLRIDNRQNWRKKHLNSIYLNYKKALYFEKYYSELEKFYNIEYEFLSDLCFDQLIHWLQMANIKKNVIKCSELNLNSKKSELILDLCKKFKSNHYISGKLGKAYLQEDDFKRENITIEYQEYKHPIYSQLWGEFRPYMSIVDLCMNTDNFSLIGEFK